MWVEVSYNIRSGYGTTYASGSTRMKLEELGAWIWKQLADGFPVLITGIRELK